MICPHLKEKKKIIAFQQPWEWASLTFALTYLFTAINSPRDLFIAGPVQKISETAFLDRIAD